MSTMATITCIKKVSLCNFIVIVFLCFALFDFSFPFLEIKHISLYANTISQSLKLNIVSNRNFQREDPCLGRYIYMHDLPPRFNKDLVKNCKTLRKKFDFCPYLENGGFGSRLVLNESVSGGVEGWYETQHNTLELIFHTRMKQYECLTRNSSLASAIYAPFYTGLEAGRYLWGGFNTSVKDAGAMDFASWQRGRPEWGPMFGWDHFFVSGRNAWDFRRQPGVTDPRIWGTKLLNIPEIQNTTMLSVESSPYADNDFAIPYPTYFHPSDESEILQWQAHVKRMKRAHLFAFAGATRQHRSSIRGELISQCKNALTNHCKLVSCGGPKDHSKIFCNPDDAISVFQNSDFCLQPPGDTFAWRSIFDAMLTGCIPVFFHPRTAYTQYFWHLPKNYTKYSVFIPSEGIKNGSVSVENFLLKISPSAVIAMRQEVIRLIPRIIYARNKLRSTEDAFDIAIRGVLKRIEEFRGLIKQGKNPGSRFEARSTWKYYLTGNISEHEWDSFF